MSEQQRSRWRPRRYGLAAILASVALLGGSALGIASSSSSSAAGTDPASCLAPVYDPATGQFDLRCTVPQATTTQTVTSTVTATQTVTTTVTATPTPTDTGTTTPPPPIEHQNTVLPARGIFAYPWFPETWSQGTNYHPSAGQYDSGTVATQQRQVASMLYGNIQFAVQSWWGQGSKTDGRFQTILDATHGTPLKVAPYYEAEGNAVSGVTGSPNPTVAQITSDLNYIAGHYVPDPNYMFVNNKPVIFVYGDGTDSCATADRWAVANAQASTRFYVVLKVFGGYAACASQPDNWHQYGPAVAVDTQGSHSVTISPGFNKAGEASPRLVRDLARWNANINTMNCSTAGLKLITTLNEWGEGSSVESATEWATSSGQGAYLDALHTNVACAAPPPTVTTTPTPPPTVTTTPTPPPSETTTPTPPPSGSLIADTIGDGGPDTAHWVAGFGTRIRADNPAAFIWSGDVRDTGTVAEWQRYSAVYGSLVQKTYPTPGNHDWGNRVTGYNVTFANDPVADIQSYCKGYSLSNGWGVFEFNSFNIGGCMPTLTAWLNATPGNRKIVVTHIPRYSGGSGHGSSSSMEPVYAAMIGHAAFYLAGHDHDAQVIDQRGLTTIVDGCAGASYYGVTPVAGDIYHSTSASDCTYGRLTLGATSAKVEMIHADGTVDFTKVYTVTP